MRDRNALIFSTVTALVGIWALLQTSGWPTKAWLYPRVILVPLVVLAVAESVLTLRGTGAQARESEPIADIAFELTVDPSLAVRRTWLTVVWVLGFFLAVILIGFQPAVPLFVLAYTTRNKEGWLLSVALAVAAALVFHGLFVSMLHLPMPQGILFRVLGR